MTKGSERVDRLAAIEDQLASARTYLTRSQEALRKCRRASGAAAHKRAWHFEEQVAKFEAQISALEAEAEELRVDPGL